MSKNCEELRDKLKERFSKGNYFKISDLLRDIRSIKQGEMNASQFFTNLKILSEEFESLRSMWCCTSDIPSKCDLSKIFVKYREMENVVCFLKGLKDLQYFEDTNATNGASSLHQLRILLHHATRKARKTRCQDHQ